MVQSHKKIASCWVILIHLEVPRHVPQSQACCKSISISRRSPFVAKLLILDLRTVVQVILPHRPFGRVHTSKAILKIAVSIGSIPAGLHTHHTRCTSHLAAATTVKNTLQSLRRQANQIQITRGNAKQGGSASAQADHPKSPSLGAGCTCLTTFNSQAPARSDGQVHPLGRPEATRTMALFPRFCINPKPRLRFQATKNRKQSAQPDCDRGPGIHMRKYVSGPNPLSQ